MMNCEDKFSCSCSYDCDCKSSTYSRTSSIAHDMSSLNNSSKEEAGQTDVEDNPQSEGEAQKRPTSESPIHFKVRKAVGADVEKDNAKKIPSANQSSPRKQLSVSSTVKINEPNSESGGKGPLFEPQGLHVLQPHSHRRHYCHHLQDQVSPDIGSRHHHRHDHHYIRRVNHKEIVPTLESCKYKDTNFSTQGSPPRARTYRKHLTTRVRVIRKGESKNRKSDSQSRQRTKCHIPASFWKEPSDVPTNDNLPHSSQEVEIGNGSGKTVVDLNKYKNESVAGPQSRPSNEKSRMFPISNRPVAATKKLKENNDSNFARAYSKPWEAQKSTRVQYPTAGKKPTKRRDFSSKKFSNLSKELKREEDKEDSSIFSSCIPSVSVLRSRRSENQKKETICQTCIDRQSNKQDVCVQTECNDNDLQATQESQTEQNAAAEAIIKPAVADLSLYAGPPPYLESSESNSISTEDTSSLTFDDDDLVNFGSSERNSEKSSRNDILSRISQVQADMEQLRFDSSSSSPEGGKLHEENAFTKNILMDLNEIVSEIYELYDDFDTDEKDEQSEFNELKKQLQQYKRTCRILEYELMSADAKSGENNQTGDLQEEIKLCRQVAVSLHWELQSADERLKLMVCENDQFRQKLAASEIQKTVLEKEVIALRNSVDQMSLHASSVPANEREAITSRDTLPELHRQIQFQNEEKKAILTKLIETNKEKNHLEKQLQLYWNRYGEIHVSDRPITEEEARSNEIKIRIRMAEDQAGMLGRKVMQLQLENEDLNQQLIEKAKAITPDISRKTSSSDLQFLEDEVEALKMTLDEVEEENSSLRLELKQSKDHHIQTEKRLQIFQATQTSLRGFVTPTTSDKIAAWEVSDRSSSRSPTPRSESDFTASGNEFMPVLTAIDEATQTYDPPQPQRATDSLDESQLERDKSAEFTLSKEFMDLLKRTDDIDVDHVVSQLTNLAIATRHLVDESLSESTKSIEHDTGSSKVTTPSIGGDHQLAFPILKDNYLELDWKPSPEQGESNQRSFTKFHFLIFSILVYIIVTSLDITSLSKFVLLTVFFFMV